jgi:hypothetical protein
MCGSDLKVAKNTFKSKKDSEDVYSELTMVCINPKCPEYAGMNLNKPKKFKTVSRKVN